MNYFIYDSGGERLDHVTQWDMNRILVISGIGSDVFPTVHFYNAKSTKAIVMSCEVFSTAEGAFKVTIPNNLLRQPIAIAAAIYFNDEVTRECVSKEIIRIPMYPRPMPEDYAFEEDEDYINWAIVTQDMLEMLDSYERYTNIVSRVDGMTVSARAISPTAAPTATISGGVNGRPYNIDFGIPKAGVDSIAVEYAVSNDGNNAPSSGWQQNISGLDMLSNAWLWTRTTVTDVDGTSEAYYYKCITGTNVISRMSSEPIADLNNVGFTDPGFVKWDSSTLHSPRTDGATNKYPGYVVHYMSDANNGVQFAWVSGETEIYTRYKLSGSWGAWQNYGDKFVNFTESLTTADQNRILNNFGLDSTNIKLWSGIHLTYIGQVTI